MAAMAIALSTSLPHLPPRRLPSHPVAALSLAPRSYRRREAPARLAAVASAFEVLDSTNGAAPAPASLAPSGQQHYGREYFLLAVVVGQMEDVFKMVEEETEVAKTQLNVKRKPFYV
ncbi:chloroplast Mg-chelatase subunit XANTHA-G precursor [Hordeum vulgare]|nr:chloroplast Mg-chelatase subunit XANTHA-G precursor [Hordeum vulgare]